MHVHGNILKGRGTATTIFISPESPGPAATARGFFVPSAER